MAKETTYDRRERKKRRPSARRSQAKAVTASARFPVTDEVFDELGAALLQQEARDEMIAANITAADAQLRQAGIDQPGARRLVVSATRKLNEAIALFEEDGFRSKDGFRDSVDAFHVLTAARVLLPHPKLLHSLATEGSRLVNLRPPGLREQLDNAIRADHVIQGERGFYPGQHHVIEALVLECEDGVRKGDLKVKDLLGRQPASGVEPADPERTELAARRDVRFGVALAMISRIPKLLPHDVHGHPGIASAIRRVRRKVRAKHNGRQVFWIAAAALGVPQWRIKSWFAFGHKQKQRARVDKK
jgi:hypothetical protein